MSKKKFVILSGLFLIFFFTPLAFYPWATSFSITKRTVAQILLLLGAAVWIFFLASDEERRLSFRSPLSLPLLAFGVVLALSLVKLRPGEWYLGLTHLGRWYAYILAFFILITTLKKRGMKFLVRVACIAGFFASIYLIVQFYGVDFPFWGDVGGRTGLFATFGNPNFIAGYLIGIIPVVTGFYIGLKRKIMVVLLGAGIATMYTAVIMTRTRASWAGLFGAAVVGLALLYLFRRDLLRASKSRIVLLLIILLAITAIYSVPNPINVKQISTIGRAGSVTDLQQGSLQHRFLMWLTAARMGAGSPIIGNGVGSFDARYPEARRGVLDKYEGFKPSAGTAYRPHNELLQLWAETGIAGVISACWILFAFLRMAYSFLSSKSGYKSGEKLSLIAFTGGAVAILGHTVFSFPFHVTPNGLLFILLVASSWGVVRSAAVEVNWCWSGVLDSLRSIRLRLFGQELGRARWVIILPLTLGCLFLIGLWTQIFRSDIYMKSGQLKMKLDRYDKAVKNLNRAKNLMPYYGKVDAELAQAYNKLDKPSKALTAAKEAEEANDQPGLMSEMGEAYRRLRKYEKAEEAFKKGIRLFPGDSSAYLGLIDLYLEQANKGLEENDMVGGEELLDRAFLYYEQAKAFNPGMESEISSRLSENYHWIAKKRLGSEKTESFWNTPDQVSIEIDTYFPANPRLDLLPLIVFPGEPIYLKFFSYSRQHGGGQIEAKIVDSEGQKVRELEVRGGKPIYSALVEKPPSSGGDFTLEVEVTYGDKTLTKSKDFMVMQTFN